MLRGRQLGARGKVALSQGVRSKQQLQEHAPPHSMSLMRSTPVSAACKIWSSMHCSGVPSCCPRLSPLPLIACPPRAMPIAHAACSSWRGHALSHLPSLYAHSPCSPPMHSILVTCSMQELEQHALQRRAIVLPAFEPHRQGPFGRDLADQAAKGE